MALAGGQVLAKGQAYGAMVEELKAAGHNLEYDELVTLLGRGPTVLNNRLESWENQAVR